MTLTELRYLVNLDKERHFGRAEPGGKASRECGENDHASGAERLTRCGTNADGTAT